MLNIIIMKKTTSAKLALIALIIFACLESYAQTYKPFSVREKIDVKGSMLVIGNNILGKDNLPFNDNTFDIAIMDAVLEHIPEVEKAISEVSRVLKPGGHFIYYNFIL